MRSAAPTQQAAPSLSLTRNASLRSRTAFPYHGSFSQSQDRDHDDRRSRTSRTNRRRPTFENRFRECDTRSFLPWDCSIAFSVDLEQYVDRHKACVEVSCAADSRKWLRYLRINSPYTASQSPIPQVMSPRRDHTSAISCRGYSTHCAGRWISACG